ncbi:MAG: AMP-binding protein, partial [Acidobacteria bacterium]|nr:AMP-binding protein [Acidobacteriota bacterium]
MTPKTPLASLSRDRRAELERLLQSKGLRSAGEASIPRRPQGQPCRASFGQERLWFLQQLDPTSAAYHIACPIRLEGKLDRAALQAAFTEMVRRHEALRTRFSLVDGALLQEPCPPAVVAMPVERLRCEPGEEREAALRRRILDEIRAPFDLASGVLLRVRLIELEEEDQVAVATMHHVAADGWSMAVMVREVARLYEAFQQGQASPLPDLPLQYGDFAEWQRETLSGETLERELSHWTQRLGGAAELELPSDRPRPAVQRNIGARCTLDLAPELAAGLRRLGAERGVTPFMTFLAGFAVLLSRYCGQSDIVIGAPVANRNRSELEDLIGFFVNTLAIRLDLSGDPSFSDLLAHVKERALEALGRQDAPFERIVEAIQPQRDRGRHPIFQTMLLVQNAPRAVLELPGLRLTPLEIDDGAAKFDLTLSLVESDGRLRCGLTYDVDLFDHATAERMLGHWATLMESAVREPERPIGLLPLLSDAERRAISSWSGETRERDESLSLTSRFARQAELRPGALALACGDERLSYGELREASLRLARRLRAEGVGPESTVGLFLPRDAAAVVAMLATLEAGGAYVPLDPAHPAERIGFLVSDARTALVLTTRPLLDKLPETAARVVLLEEVEAQALGEQFEQPRVGPDPDNLAYMIYTSGSTGAPKGVAISHRSACAMIDWALETFSREDFAATLAATSFTFDLSIFEIFAPLSMGGAVVLAENALALAGPPLDPPVTLVNTVPSALAHLLRTTALP